MFALVESGSITKFFSGNRGITIGDKQYPKAIFTLWTKSEREAIGIYEVEMDTSKRKDEKWYINTMLLILLEVVKLQVHMVMLQLKLMQILYGHHKIKQMVKYLLIKMLVMLQLKD